MSNIASRNKKRRKKKSIPRISQFQWGQIIALSKWKGPTYLTLSQILSWSSKVLCYFSFLCMSLLLADRTLKNSNISNTREERSLMLISLCTYFALAIMTFCSWSHRIRTGRVQKGITWQNESSSWLLRDSPTDRGGDHSRGAFTWGTGISNLGPIIYNFPSNLVINLPNPWSSGQKLDTAHEFKWCHTLFITPNQSRKIICIPQSVAYWEDFFMRFQEQSWIVFLQYYTHNWLQNTIQSSLQPGFKCTILSD